MPRRRGTEAVLEEIERRIDNNELLSPEEREEVRDRARKHVAEARKKKEVDAYFAAQVRVEEVSYEPTQQLEDFTVDLPEYTPMIKINNVGYFHGCTYEVPYNLARSMADLQGWAWKHENEWKQGKHHSAHRPLDRVMNARGVVTTRSNMREPRL